MPANALSTQVVPKILSLFKTKPSSRPSQTSSLCYLESKIISEVSQYLSIQDLKELMLVWRDIHQEFRYEMFSKLAMNFGPLNEYIPPQDLDPRFLMAYDGHRLAGLLQDAPQIRCKIDNLVIHWGICEECVSHRDVGPVAKVYGPQLKMFHHLRCRRLTPEIMSDLSPREDFWLKKQTCSMN